MKKIFIFFCFLILGFTLASSQVQTLGGDDGYPPNTDIRLIQTCGNCSFINITQIKLGNNSIVYLNAPMTKVGTAYNYTLSSEYTTSTGEYIVSWVADPDGFADSGSYNLFVRKGGILLTTGQSILYVFIIIFSLALSIFFGYFAIIIPYSDFRTKDGSITRIISAKYLKLLSIGIGWAFFVWFLSVLSNVMNILLYLETTNSLFTNLYIYAYSLGWVLTIIIFILSFIEIYKDILIPLFKRILLKWG